MRAAILQSIDTGEIVIRDDVEVLGPGPGEVRVAIRAAGICHSDLSARLGDLPQPVPAILGHEAAGEVIAIGPGVSDVSVGDHVIVNWAPSCGRCRSCLRHEPYLCTYYVMKAYTRPRFRLDGAPVFAFSGCGAFAEETVVPARGVVKIPSDVPFDVAALIGCGVMTGVGAVLNTAKVPAGSSVAVIGCGGVGIAVIQGSRIAGASVIVGVDSVPEKNELAKRFGATHFAAPGVLAGLSEELTAGEGFDFVFEAVGQPQTIRAAWEATRRGGTVVVVGAGRMDVVVEFSPFELMFEGKTLVGSLYGSADADRDYLRLIDLWRSGSLQLDAMISHRLGLDDVDQALQALGRGDVIRQVIIYD